MPQRNAENDEKASDKEEDSRGAKLHVLLENLTSEK